MELVVVISIFLYDSNHFRNVPPSILIFENYNTIKNLESDFFISLPIPTYDTNHDGQLDKTETAKLYNALIEQLVAQPPGPDTTAMLTPVQQVGGVHKVLGR